jgi:hypothetical protein
MPYLLKNGETMINGENPDTLRAIIDYIVIVHLLSPKWNPLFFLHWKKISAMVMVSEFF